MNQLQDLQFPIDQSIFAAVLACIPSDWGRAQLVASVEESAGSRSATSMSVRIDALSQPGIALVSDELQDRVRELFLVNAKFKTNLRGITYNYTRNADGRWLFKGDYAYQ